MEEINLKDLFKFFLAKIKIILIFILSCVVVGIIYINFIIVPKYHSSTTLILVSNESNQNSVALQSEVTVNKNLVTTYSQIVKSRSVLQKVINELNINQTITQLSDNINVTAVEDTELIKIEVTDKNNKQAQKIANTTAKIFMKEVKRIYNLTNVSVVDKAYLEKQPYNINPVKQILIAAVVGLCLGLCVVFLIFYFDTSIKTSNDIEEKLGLPVIGNVVLVEEKKKGKKRNGRE